MEIAMISYFTPNLSNVLMVFKVTGNYVDDNFTL